MSESSNGVPAGTIKFALSPICPKREGPTYTLSSPCRLENSQDLPFTSVARAQIGLCRGNDFLTCPARLDQASWTLGSPFQLGLSLCSPQNLGFSTNSMGMWLNRLTPLGFLVLSGVCLGLVLEVGSCGSYEDILGDSGGQDSGRGTLAVLCPWIY